jgi:hypothetical protein
MTLIQLKRSETPNKRPDPAQLAIGELAMNYADGSAGLFFRNSTDQLTKVGPVEISDTAPNSTPAGFAGNCLGEMWLDTSVTPSEFKVWTSQGWIAPGSALTLAGLTNSDTDTPASCTFFGVGAGSTVTTGAGNSFFGFNAGSGCTTGTNNVVVGLSNSLQNTTSRSVIIGSNNGIQGTGPSSYNSLVLLGNNNLTQAGGMTAGVLIGSNIASTSGASNDVAFSVVIGADTAKKGARSSIVIGNGTFQNTKDYFTDDNLVIGNGAFNMTITGYADRNVVIGNSALSGATGFPGTQHFGSNVVIGYSALTNAGPSSASTVSENNVVIGYNAGNKSLVSNNILMGSGCGSALGSVGGCIILGPWAGDNTQNYSDNIIFAPGGSVRLRINGNGAISPGGLSNFGTAGQFLKSAGSGGPPVWSSLAMEGEPPTTFTSADGKTITVEGGLITSIS